MDITRIRKLFPVTKKWVYMNHAAVAPLSTRVVKAMELFLQDQLENGSVNWKDWFETYARARSLAARLINAHADEIAFVKNTSEGVSMVANGLRLGRGAKVVLAEPEFPSNILPWIALERRGVKVKWITERAGRIPLESVRKALRGRPQVLAISFVEFLSGFRNDLIEIGKMCEERSVFFFVDAIQGLGAFPLDVREARIDALACDSKKWLLGPEGAAFLYCSRSALDKLDVTEHGWTSVKSPSDFFSRSIEYAEGARRLEPGGLNTAGLHGLVAALELTLEVGTAEIAERLLGLTGRLGEGLEARGCRLLGPRAAAERSGIVSFKHPRASSDLVVERLLARSVVAANRLGWVRLSPHYYLTEEEVDHVLDALP